MIFFRFKLIDKFFKAAFVSLLCVLMISCQPNPDTNIVVNKNDFEEYLFLTPTPISEDYKEIIIPDEFTVINDGSEFSVEENIFEIVDGDGENNTKITVKVDADIVVSYEKASVFLVEPASFDMDTVMNAKNYFFTDEYYSDVRTQDDYVTQILYYEQSKNAIPEKLLEVHGISKLILEDKYRKAPVVNEEADMSFKSYFGLDYAEYVGLKWYPRSGVIGELFVGNGCSLFSSQFSIMYYVEDNLNGYYYDTQFDYNGTPAKGMSTPYSDAKENADKVVKELVGSGYSHVKSGYAYFDSLDSRWTAGRCAFENNDKLDQCYVFYYTPNYGELAQLYAPKASNTDNKEINGVPVKEETWQEMYNETLSAEYICVYINDNGLVEFWWISPIATIKTINDDVKTLSFEEIYDIFRKNIYFQSAWSADYAASTDIVITDIIFGSVRIPIKDRPGYYYMVPAWQFVGSKTDYTSLSDFHDSYEDGKTFMVINAIDGSIIDISFYNNERINYVSHVGLNKSPE